jgi:hypothetical protein
VALLGRNIESRSLTLSKFDFQGKPHIFYDDHLQLLRRSDCFVARKIWPRADRLYRTFLSAEHTGDRMAEPAPGKIDRIFSKALERRTRGRPGLYMQSRFPNPGWENGVTAGPYSVFHGFNDLFQDFEAGLLAGWGRPCMPTCSLCAARASAAGRCLQRRVERIGQACATTILRRF